MDHQKTIPIKEEEADCAPVEPGLLCHQTLTVGHQQNIQIKEEEADYAPDEPGFTFLGVPGLPIMPDPELELHEDSSENNPVECPLDISWPTDLIKEKPALNLEAVDITNICQQTLTVDHQQNIQINEEETDYAPDEPGFTFLGVRGLPIKPDPELELHVDSSENKVVPSTRCIQNSARVIQNSGTSCGIQFGESVVQGLVPNELEICAEGSTCLTMSNTYTRGKEVKEESLSVARLKCSRRENEFHKFICNFCLQRYSSKYRFIRHVFIHMDGVQPPEYICKFCGEIFSSEIGLNRHFKMNVNDQAPSAGHNDKTDGIYKYENILLDADNISVIQVSQKKSSPQIKSKAGTKPHTCDVCGKSFARSSYLKNHVLIHTGERPHKCNVCGMSFIQLVHLKTHELKHTGVKPHKCNICGMSYTQPRHLKRHALIHTGDQPYQCSVCGKSFSLLEYLKAHSFTHTGERPHQCNVCGKSFTQLRLLNRHALIHTGVKPYKCNVCGKSFGHLRSLKTHSLIHIGAKPHKCNVCGKSFTQLCNLKGHLLIHTGERPHKCNVCGMSFNKSGTLKRHALIHTVGEPHVCIVCGKAFNNLRTFKRHALIHSSHTSLRTGT